ncbi:MAG: SpoIIE family protein phosphatase [Polyangiaceae bacterium]
MSARTPTIAILVDYLVASYQVSLIRAVERASAERGVNLLTVAGRALHAPSIGDATQNRIYELLTPTNVDGIILVAGCMSYASGAQALAEYSKRYHPVPICSVGIELPAIPSLVISNRQGSHAIVEHLITKHGAHRIAYIGGPEANREAADRFDGYRLALDRAGIPFDESLFVRGDFSLPAGLAAMKELFSREASFDSVVAANDYMAIGALEVLRDHGLRVPDDVMLAGFDDAPFARFALPSLTTVRQPLDKVARIAVDSLLRRAAFETSSDVIQIDVEVVARQSCGCGLVSRRQQPSILPKKDRDNTVTELLRCRESLIEALHTNVGIPPEALSGWGERLLDALHVELTGQAGRFMATITALLEEAQPHPDFVDELGKVVFILRSELQRIGPVSDVALELEHLFYVGQVAVGNAATNVQGREKLDLQVVIDAVRIGFERIGTALSRPTLSQAVLGMLPDVNVRRASISLVDEEEPEHLVPFVTVCPEVDQERQSQQRFLAIDLVPKGFFPERRHSHIVIPLSFEQDFFGLLVAEYTTNETVYGLLRDHISSALKGGQLYRAALRQAALRERAEREHLQQEALIAARIQTAILPHQTDVAGLEVSARMVPAVDIGGDYYDVIPTENGCWLGIGDVTGHGLIAGLVMLMVQGMIAAMVRREPAAQPSGLITSLNAALYENVRNRLSRDDHATLTLLRYDRDGTVTYAGAHEDIIVYRCHDRSIELLRSPGFWSGALQDVASLTHDETLSLQRGDLLVLYSDGVTEAMNERGEQFGLTRLCAVVKDAGARPPMDVSDAIVKAVEQWQTRQIDDVTVLVARYQGN